MAYFVADEKLQGYYVSDGVTINIVKYHFECDDAASLPAQTAFISSKKVKISMASTAHTIDTDALYEMDSSGAWVQQSQPWQPLADYSVLSNKPKINGHTLTGNQSGDDLGLQNTLTFDAAPTQNSTNPVTSAGVWTDQQRQDALQAEDRAALVELVDGGAKNLLKNELGSGTKSGLAFTTGTDGSIVITAGTATGGNADFVIPFTPTKTGQYVLQGCPDGGSGETYKGQIVLYPSMANVAAIFDNASATATLTGGTQYAYRFRVYNGKAISDSTIYPMVCSKAAWDVSHAYQQYRPSWQEMYEMILALQ